MPDLDRIYNAKCITPVSHRDLLDDEEAAVLASQVDLKKFAARERIYKVGDPGAAAYVATSVSQSASTLPR